VTTVTTVTTAADQRRRAAGRVAAGERAAGESPPGQPLRPVDLGRAVGLSAEMARRYERWGYLPPAGRSASGRRLFGPRHLHAILTARELRAGYGWEAALDVMRRLHRGDLAGALTRVDERHAALHRRRLEADETLRALELLAGAGPAANRAGARARGAPAGWRSARGPAPLRIGEAARRAGVRPSAVRFWEAQGLLRPPRDDASGYRLYDAEQLVRLQIVAVLRGAHYPFAAIAGLLAELAGGRPETVLATIERRRDELTQASERCARATAAFWGYTAAVFGKPAAAMAAGAPPAGPPAQTPEP
jgi:DNA-binding transcriptional MerR regulator